VGSLDRGGVFFFCFLSAVLILLTHLLLPFSLLVLVLVLVDADAGSCWY